MPEYIIHIDIIAFTDICEGSIQYHLLYFTLLCCDEFSTHLPSFPMRTKSNNDIILAFTLMISFYKQHGYTIQIIPSDHETTILSAQVFLNHQGSHPINMNKNWNDMSKQLILVLLSIKFKLPNPGQKSIRLCGFFNFRIFTIERHFLRISLMHALQKSNKFIPFQVHDFIDFTSIFTHNYVQMFFQDKLLHVTYQLMRTFQIILFIIQN